MWLFSLFPPVHRAESMWPTRAAHNRRRAPDSENDSTLIACVNRPSGYSSESRWDELSQNLRLRGEWWYDRNSGESARQDRGTDARSSGRDCPPPVNRSGGLFQTAGQRADRLIAGTQSDSAKHRVLSYGGNKRETHPGAHRRWYG